MTGQIDKQTKSPLFVGDDIGIDALPIFVTKATLKTLVQDYAHDEAKAKPTLSNTKSSKKHFLRQNE